MSENKDSRIAEKKAHRWDNNIDNIQIPIECQIKLPVKQTKQGLFVIYKVIPTFCVNLKNSLNMFYWDLTDAQNSTTETQNKNLRRKIKNTKISQNLTNKIKLLKNKAKYLNAKFYD